MVLEKSKLLEMLIGPSLLLISILEDRGITLSSCDLQGDLRWRIALRE